MNCTHSALGTKNGVKFCLCCGCEIRPQEGAREKPQEEAPKAVKRKEKPQTK